MISRAIPVAVVLLLLPAGLGQPAPDIGPPPDLGPASQIIDEVAGTVIPPVTDLVYGAVGQELTEEDIRLFLDLNITKGEITPLGFLVGSGNIEMGAEVSIRGELRVISTERIKKAIEGENAYNLSAENATWMSEVYIPAEAFRITLTAEIISLFQDEMEASMRELLEKTVPELNILSFEITWENTSPLNTFTDLSLTEPPIVLNVAASIEYLRVESLGSLLNAYLESADEPKPGADYIESAKATAGDPLRTREFFSAAAYDQLLNLSMQPGWSLHVSLAVPPGYSFEYVNEEVSRPNNRELHFSVDGDEATEEDPKIVIASITHRRAVAAGLLIGMVGVVLFVAQPLTLIHSKVRKPKGELGKDDAGPKGPAN